MAVTASVTVRVQNGNLGLRSVQLHGTCPTPWLQCPNIPNCGTYAPDCSCTACSNGYEECTTDVCVDLNSDTANW